MFPIEIWEMIFKVIEDPILLTRLEVVCKAWYYVIEKMLNKHPKWKQLTQAQDSVPKFWEMPILMRNYPEIYDRSSKNTNREECINRVSASVWRKIYTGWINFQKTITLPRSVDPRKINEILKFSESERLTCFHMQWTIVAFATTENLVYFSMKYDIKNPFFIVDHGQPVTEIQLCSVNDCPRLAITTCLNGFVRYWNFLSRTEIQSGGNLGLHLQTSVLEDQSCYSLWMGCLSHYNCQDDFVSRTCEYRVMPLDPTREIVLFNCLFKQLLILDNNDNSTTLYNWGGFPSRCQANLWAQAEEETRWLPADFAASKLKIFKLIVESFIMCLTDNWLAFSIDNEPWVLYNIHSFVGGNVKCVDEDWTYDSDNRLFLGLDTGDVYIFTAENPEAWLSYDFANATPVKLTFGTDAINSIVYELNQIIVMTEKNIYIHNL